MKYSIHAVLLAGLAAAMPAHAATTMFGASPMVICRDGAAANASREISIPANRDGLANCTAALSDKLSNADRTATLANRGIIETALGNTDAALADFNQALDRDPQAANVYVNRGAALMKTGQFENARADFDHALQLNADNQAVAYFDRGMANEKLGNLSAAYHDYKWAQNLQPDYKPASVELARFQVDQRYAAN